MARHVILGGGPAGIAAIDTIRAVEGPSAAITLVSDEPAYSRMVLPYYLAQEIPEQHVHIGDRNYFTRQNVDVRLGMRAQSINAQVKTVTLGDGTTLPFDSLLIATGSSAQRPPFPGADLDGVHCLTLGRVKPSPFRRQL